jgi:hypothetical protein
MMISFAETDGCRERPAMENSALVEIIKRNLFWVLSSLLLVVIVVLDWMDIQDPCLVFYGLQCSMSLICGVLFWDYTPDPGRTLLRFLAHMTQPGIGHIVLNIDPVCQFRPILREGDTEIAFSAVTSGPGGDQESVISESIIIRAALRR